MDKVIKENGKNVSETNLSNNKKFNDALKVLNKYIKTELKDELREVLNTLTVREKEVLELRFGLFDGSSHTLEEVGKKFKVTRERIRQIEAKALRKLRHPSRAKKLKDFLIE